MHLRAGQREQATGLCRLRVGKGAMQPHRRSLEEIVGIVPATNPRKPGEHAMCEEVKPLAAQLEDAAASLEVAQRDIFKTAGYFIRKHAGISAGRPVNAARARRSVLLLHRETHRFGEG